MRVPSFFRPLRRDRPWWGIAAGAILFGLAGVVRWRFGGLTEGFGPMLLLPAILLAGLFGGIRVGLGAFIVCFLTAWVWFFPALRNILPGGARRGDGRCVRSHGGA